MGGRPALPHHDFLYPHAISASTAWWPLTPTSSSAPSHPAALSQTFLTHLLLGPLQLLLHIPSDTSAITPPPPRRLKSPSAALAAGVVHVCTALWLISSVPRAVRPTANSWWGTHLCLPGPGLRPWPSPVPASFSFPTHTSCSTAQIATASSSKPVVPCLHLL